MPRNSLDLRNFADCVIKHDPTTTFCAKYIVKTSFYAEHKYVQFVQLYDVILSRYSGVLPKRCH